MCIEAACGVPEDVARTVPIDRRHSAIGYMIEILSEDKIPKHVPMERVGSAFEPYKIPGAEGFAFSYKHDAYYRVFSRFVRSIWTRKMLISDPKKEVEKGEGKADLEPLLTADQLEVVARPLRQFVDVLERFHRNDVLLEPAALKAAGEAVAGGTRGTVSIPYPVRLLFHTKDDTIPYDEYNNLKLLHRLMISYRMCNSHEIIVLIWYTCLICQTSSKITSILHLYLRSLVRLLFSFCCFRWHWRCCCRSAGSYSLRGPVPE